MSELPRPPFVAGNLLVRVPRPAPIAAFLPAIIDHAVQMMGKYIVLSEKDGRPRR